MRLDPDTRDTLITLAAVLTFLGGVIVALWRGWLRPLIQREVAPVPSADLAELKHLTREVLDQVSNDHESNLRNDLDDVHESLRDFRREVRAEFAAMRAGNQSHLVDAAGDKVRLADVERRLDRANL